MAARFEIRKSKKPFMKQKFHVATIGKNNKVLQTSEKLTSVEDCYTNIQAMREITGMIGVVDTTR